MKSSQQERLVIEFLTSKQEVYWEELVQFCKDPTQVKLKTVKKIVSDIRKKYRDNNLTLPFSCTITSIPSQLQEVPKMVSISNTINFNGQKLVQVKLAKKTITSNESTVTKPNTISPEPDKSLDFVLNTFARQVITHSGLYALNGEEFEILTYLYNNKGKFISLEELRDKICYPQYGSKTPPRWFLAIQRRVGNIRHQIPETKNRLLTAKQQNIGGYIFN